MGETDEVTPELERQRIVEAIGTIEREPGRGIERATIVCDDGIIRPRDLSMSPVPPALTDTTDLEVIERRAIEQVMREVNGNKVRASRQLGISRTQLYLRLRKHGLDDCRPGA